MKINDFSLTFFFVLWFLFDRRRCSCLYCRHCWRRYHCGWRKTWSYWRVFSWNYCKSSFYIYIKQVKNSFFCFFVFGLYNMIFFLFRMKIRIKWSKIFWKHGKNNKIILKRNKQKKKQKHLRKFKVPSYIHTHTHTYIYTRLKWTPSLFFGLLLYIDC